MTIYDIAKEAGVSAATVSRVINNRPGIKESTREKVRSILEEHNFSVSATARSLVSQSSMMIGILISDIRNLHYTEGAYIIEKQMLKSGYCSIIMNTGTAGNEMASAIKTLSQRRVDGVVLIGSSFANDDVRSAICSYMKLLGRGRRHLAFINSNNTPSNSLKIEGFLSAVGDDGILIDGVPDSYDGGYEATRDLLQKYPEVDGIIYAVDILAVGGSRAILDMGKRIAEDISIFGFDNSPYAELSNPKLSSIDSRLNALSLASADALLSLIRGESVEKSQIFPPSLVIRET